MTTSGRLIGLENTVTSSDSDSEEELKENFVSTSAGDQRRFYYLRKHALIDHATQNVTENLEASNPLKPTEYFLAYVNKKFWGEMAMYTNMK